MANGATVRTIDESARGIRVARYSAGPSQAKQTKIPNTKNVNPFGVRTSRSSRRNTPEKCNRRSNQSARGIKPQQCE
jgi:hypothetical protein